MTKKPIVKQMIALLSRFDEPNLSGKTWVFTREDIALLCRFVASNYYDGKLMAEVCKHPGTDEQFNTMNDAMADGLVMISRKHEDLGLAWLWQTRDRFAAPLGAKEVDIMRRFLSFRFVGVAVHPAGGTHSYIAAPIYRVIGDTGSFTYEAWSWQSGKKPQLVGA